MSGPMSEEPRTLVRLERAAQMPSSLTRPVEAGVNGTNRPRVRRAGLHRSQDSALGSSWLLGALSAIFCPRYPGRR